MRLVQTLLLLLTTLTIQSFAFSQDKSKQEILTSIGQASKWNNVNYILFSSTNNTGLFKERSFLIDKSTGRSRFEGKTNTNQHLILLFNFKSKVLEKSYSNGKLNDSKAGVPYQEVLNQLFEDSKLLFLPMFVIATTSNNLTINPGKIINAEKLIEITFKNVYNLNKQPLNGMIYLNSKGEIKEYCLDQQILNVSEIKDIGDGILLPTLFNSKNDPKMSIKFNTVAAFTDIENDKFTTL